MSLANWVSNLSPPMKLLFGLACGLGIYGLFRWLIYLVNKDVQKNNVNKDSNKINLSRKERIKFLMSQQE